MTNALKSYGFEKLNYCASEIKRCSPLFGWVTYVVWKLKIDDRIDNVRSPGPPPAAPPTTVPAPPERWTWPQPWLASSPLLRPLRPLICAWMPTNESWRKVTDKGPDRLVSSLIMWAQVLFTPSRYPTISEASRASPTSTSSLEPVADGDDRPACFFCHRDGVCVCPSWGRTVSKKLSCVTCYWGLTKKPVVFFKRPGQENTTS